MEKIGQIYGVGFWTVKAGMGEEFVEEWQKSGLIVHLTSSAGFEYNSNVTYGVSKASVNRMPADMAHELREYQIAVVALCPGRTETEMIMARKGSMTYNESPQFVGRSVVALANDPRVLEKSGQILITRQLGVEYGFTDIDGKLPSMDKGF
jgi:dehydrogenase/reductase SDR family protein 1